MQQTNHSSARLASLSGLLETTITAFLHPVPSRETLRDWFDQARIPRFKANPTAKRGGGTVFYSVAAVEKLLQSRTLPCRLPAVSFPARSKAQAVGGVAN
jgi:hypothetical protein